MESSRQGRTIATLTMAGMLLLLIGASGLLVLTSMDIFRTGLEAKSSAAFIQTMQAVLQRVSDAETGERGYLLTQDDSYLEPFMAAKRALVDDLKELGRQAEANPRQAEQIRDLITMTNARYDLLERIIAMEQDGHHDEALTLLRSNRGHSYMQRIREAVNHLVVDESSHLQARFAHDAKARRELLAIAVTILFTSAGLLAWSLALSRKDGRSRARAEEALRQSEAKLRLVMDSSRDYALFTLDADGRVATWSGGAAHLMGWTAEEAIGGTVDRLFTAEDVAAGKPARELAEARRTGKIETQGQRRKKDGSLYWADVVVTSMWDEQGAFNGFSVLARDITPQVLTEQALQAAKESAERANATKTKFIAFISHELRTPLGAVIGFSELGLCEGIGEEERSSYFAIIKRNAQHLLDLINDLLDLSKIDAGRLEVNESTFLVTDFVRDLTELFRPIALAKGLVLEVAVDPGVPALISTDATRLKQVVTNLLGNALKFTETGRVRLHVHAPKAGALVARRQRQAVAFDVSDTGIGIAAEAQKRIFDPYHQADKTTTQKYGGTGLGLALARALARTLGGELALVTSTMGEGSLFRATVSAGVPSNEVRAVEAAAETGRVSPLPRVLDGRKVLVVDDSNDMRAYLKAILEAAGAAVTEARDGVDAIERCKDHAYDTVLMDIQMPRCDGLEATRIMKRHGFRAPVVALTAQVLAMLGEADQSLFQALLFKPVQPERLLETVAGLAGGSLRLGGA